MGAFALLVCFLFLRFSSNQICQVLRLSLIKNSIVLEILQKSKQVQAETKKKKDLTVSHPWKIYRKCFVDTSALTECLKKGKAL